VEKAISKTDLFLSLSASTSKHFARLKNPGGTFAFATHVGQGVAS
jgi:hypothetical protein